MREGHGGIGRSALAGAVDGTAATLAMTAVMLGAVRAGWVGEPPFRRITRRALRKIGGAARSGRTHDGLSAAVHLAFGAGAGSLFEAAYRRAPRPVPGSVAGAAFGAAVFLVSYAGWVPALGLMPPPHRDRPGRQAWTFVAHLVYGAVLGALAERRAARGLGRREVLPA